MHPLCRETGREDVFLVLFQMVLVKNKSNFKFSLEVRKVWLLLQ